MIQNRCIISVAENSPAEKAKIKTDHTVVSVNNINVIGMGDQELKELIFDSDGEVYMETVCTYLFNDICVGMSETEISTYWFDTFAPVC